MNILLKITFFGNSIRSVPGRHGKLLYFLPAPMYHKKTVPPAHLPRRSSKFVKSILERNTLAGVPVANLRKRNPKCFKESPN